MKEISVNLVQYITIILFFTFSLRTVYHIWLNIIILISKCKSRSFVALMLTEEILPFLTNTSGIPKITCFITITQIKLKNLLIVIIIITFVAITSMNGSQFIVGRWYKCEGCESVTNQSVV